MFEVYRDLAYDADRFRVVYYTELDEHNKDAEIRRAQNGEHFIDGFLLAYKLPETKKAVAALVERLNRGDPVTPADFQQAIAPFAPAPR
jgi:hypothetical protein